MGEWTVVFLCFLLSAQAWAAPAQVVIIRHGEKPATGNGVNQQGCERAYSLPPFFESNAVINQFGTPIAIFAAAPAKNDGSIRSIETITPTASALGLKINNTFTKTDNTAAAQEILTNSSYTNKTVLVAWEHDNIPALAQALGLALTTQTQQWPAFVFDEAWVLGFQNPAQPGLQILPEDVLPGDNLFGGLNQWNLVPTQMSTTPVSPSIVQECANDQALDALMASVIQVPNQ